MPEMLMHIKYVKRGHFLPYGRQNYSIKIHFGTKVISLPETFKKITCVYRKRNIFNSPVRNQHSSHFLMLLIIVYR